MFQYIFKKWPLSSKRSCKQTHMLGNPNYINNVIKKRFRKNGLKKVSPDFIAGCWNVVRKLNWPSFRIACKSFAIRPNCRPEVFSNGCWSLLCFCPIFPTAVCTPVVCTSAAERPTSGIGWKMAVRPWAFVQFHCEFSVISSPFPASIRSFASFDDPKASSTVDLGFFDTSAAVHEVGPCVGIDPSFLVKAFKKLINSFIHSFAMIDFNSFTRSRSWLTVIVLFHSVCLIRFLSVGSIFRCFFVFFVFLSFFIAFHNAFYVCQWIYGLWSCLTPCVQIFVLSLILNMFKNVNLISLVIVSQIVCFHGSVCVWTWKINIKFDLVSIK